MNKFVLKIFINHYWHIYIQFQITLRSADTDPCIIGHDLYGNHDDACCRFTAHKNCSNVSNKNTIPGMLSTTIDNFANNSIIPAMD